MNLKSLTDSVLMANARTLAREEREKLTRFLHHLKEIERRRLFSAYGYRSLIDMTVRHFGYSEDEAYRRISAMKLLKEIPEIEGKINSGEMSLTHLSLVQKHFRQEKKVREVSLKEKKKLINQLSKTSIREAERITLSLSSHPEQIKPERFRVVSDNRIEVRFLISLEVEEKLKMLRGLIAHKHSNPSMAELFELLLEIGLEKFSVAPQKRCVKMSKAQMRRDVFLRAKHRCENCGSQFALEVDHIQPKALGGQDVPENLRLLCRSCNQRAAIEVFGSAKMDPYLNSHFDLK